MDIRESVENADYLSFLNREFPNPKGRYPDIDRSISHLDKISKQLLECARRIHGQAEDDKKQSALHINTRTITAGNFRIRTISLIKTFNDIMDARGDLIFDQGTANIIVRSLLESYLVYYRLYNGCKGNKNIQELYFNLYDLSSVLHYVKYANSMLSSLKNKVDDDSLSKRIADLISRIKKTKEYQKLPTKIRDGVSKIELGQQDYLSLINFNRLIRESPLPTELITSYYSYASSFTHSEGFSADILQAYFESRAQRKSINDMLKFRLVYICLAVSSQFFKSFNEYDSVEMQPEDNEMREAIWLSNYYHTAINHNQ
ncbi:MAG: hypothetical protein EOO47_22475 [Flavobacterium sp.]|nr:MAG: hypothetical protein EOO47_22475 [Flavobacterium sp.]